MTNFYFRIIVIGLYFTGTMTNPSRKSSILFNSECQWNEYLLANCSFTAKHDIPVDISQTAAKVDVSFSFFRVLLQSHMKKEDWKIKCLDLSNNLISKITLSPLTYLHALEILNLSNNAIHSIPLDLPRPKFLFVKCYRSSFRSGLPFLRVLILRRNKLIYIPKGLWKLKSLQSLDLSFNGILQIGLSDFHNCLKLEHLYLKSNKIFKIHPEAFKDLKKLQVVDLSNNALATILPMLILALELPHLEVDLADNQWQCDSSMAVFQNVISESWRKKWNVICNKSTGNEEAYWGTSKSRISREAHLPHFNLNHMKSLMRSKAEKHWEGRYMRFSTLGRKTRMVSDLREKQSPQPRRVRNARDVHTTGRKKDDSQHLALAVCLSVFITFFVAFCLGAFARPYVDRLWRHRCRNKSPGSNNAHSNEGFYDDIEAAGNIQRPRADLHPAFHDLNLCENQDGFLVTEPSPHTAVIPEQTLGKEPGSQQSSERYRHNPGAGSRTANVLPNGSTARAILRGHPNADKDGLISAAQGHIYKNNVLRESNYETVAPEDDLHEHARGVSSVAGTLQTVSGSTRNDSNELDLSLSREMTASLSKMPTHTNAQRTGENRERWGTEQLPWEITGSQMGFPKEARVSADIHLLSTQHHRLQGAHVEEEPSACCSTITHSDLGDTGPAVLPPGWGSVLDVTPAKEEPVQECVPSDTQYEVDTNCDSDEGSLFTLSSVSSEGAGDVTGEEAQGEVSCGAREPPQDESPGLSKDSIMSVESLEGNIAFQKILGKCENQEDGFEKCLLSGPDSGLYETQQKRTNSVDILLQTPTCPGEVPLDPDNSP
ncbi:PREDICTED: leucine-rich repeat-containing protein 66 [Galeopterus variegatus]|uniref:Leucine-rich repeat-containing protein 66 n=1 Tax=Galeopterus variegatus TaxID=482537 RepID=A0ABM0RXC4_GALVR|nr:PREDICTED: leucine-rich repeat-containing protein 66 [Galeopterus variegatus]